MDFLFLSVEGMDLKKLFSIWPLMFTVLLFNHLSLSLMPTGLKHFLVRPTRLKCIDSKYYSTVLDRRDG